MESYRKNSENYLKADLLTNELSIVENTLEKKVNEYGNKIDELENFNRQILNDFKKIIENLTS